MAIMEPDEVRIAEEEKEKDDNSEFIASVVTNAFKEAFNTTLNPNDWNLKHIYTGGYSPVISLQENMHAVNPNPNTFNAAAATVVQPAAFTNQRENTKIFINGENVLINDIVAKAAFPYTKGLRRRFINAVMSDPVIGTVFGVITFYVFNVNRKSSIRPIGDYRTKTQKELDDKLKEIIPIDIQQSATNFLDNVDTHSHVWDFYAPLSFYHMLTHGTGAFFKELINTNEIVNPEQDIDIPLGTPAILKELDPMYFEKVFQNRKTFNPLFMEYTDQNYELIDDEIFNNPKAEGGVYEYFKGWKQLVIKDPSKPNNNAGKNIMLPINQLVIFRNQINPAPNVSFFGISKIFSIMPISEIQRELNYNVMPSVNKVQSQGSCIINTKIKSELKNKEMVKQLQQGTNYIVTNSEGLDVKNIAINVDLAGLAKERFDNVLMEAMGLNYPSPLINFEGVTNRATMDTVLQFFQNTSLESLRDIVSTAMNNQWYIPNLMFYFNFVLPKTKLEGQSKEIKRWNYINLKIKVLTEFEKLDFDLFTEKLTALGPVSFITDQEKREKIGMDPFPINDPNAENAEKVNKQLNEMGELVQQDDNKQVIEMQGQLKEFMDGINDPELKKIMMKRMIDKGIVVR